MEPAAPERRLTPAELAERAGVTPERLADFDAVGVLRRGADGRYEPGDVHRVRLVRAFEESGIPLDALTAAEAAGSITFAYYDLLHAPAGTPSRRTYGDLVKSLGTRRADLLRRWFGAVGVAEPALDALIDVEDEALLTTQATILADLADPSLGLRVARLQGAAAHQVAEGSLSIYAEGLVQYGVDAAELPLQEAWQTYLEPWTRLARYAPASTAWVQARHLSSAIDAFSVAETERFLERSGYVPERQAEPPAIAFVDIAGFTRLSEERGDQAAAVIASAFSELAAECARSAGGRVVKLLGDGALLRFGGAAAAAGASLAIIDAMAQDGLPPVHAGVADGAIVVRDGDVFGRTVNLASRIADLAEPGVLLVPSALGDRLVAAGYVLSSPRTHRFHGVGEPVDLVEVSRR